MTEVAMLVVVFWLGFTVRMMLAELARFVAIAILAIFASQRFASTSPILDAIVRRSRNGRYSRNVYRSS